ncbi:MAG: carboxypeptidase M32, partial [Alphaproteobacteria bacterium]|nr:carboxypeptidase M32 [Alphaproteobacteria bacterium]
MPYAVAHAKLQARFARLIKLEETAGFLNWDTATMMPVGGAASRAEQMATIKTLHHELLTAPEVAGWLDAAEASVPADTDPWSRANLREMRRLWVHGAAVPTDLIEALSRAEAACEMTWRTARAQADFASVAPRLKQVLDLVRQVAAAKAERLGCTPYDALLDQYEPGAKSARIDQLFGQIEPFLPDFLARVLERQSAAPPVLIPQGPFPTERQRALGLKLMAVLGFDFEHGRLDISHHPFCGGTQDDVRLTTRYDEADFTSSLMGVLHETGHALYEMGLPGEWRYQPVGRARGMSVHESQSLLIEMQACRSQHFVAWAAPRLQAAFAGSGDCWEADNLYRLGIRVEPGFIRVDADEVT